jgi:hypothetical protein
MARAVAGEPRGVTIELVGAPEHVLAAFQANASDDPEEVKAAKQRLRERNGADYSWDPETKLFERLPAVVHTPQRREAAIVVARAREQGTGRRRTASRASPDDPSEPEPPPVEVWRGVAAASVRMQTRLARRRAKWAAA